MIKVETTSVSLKQNIDRPVKGQTPELGLCYSIISGLDVGLLNVIRSIIITTKIAPETQFVVVIN